MYIPKSFVPDQPAATGYTPKSFIPDPPEKKTIGGFLKNTAKSAGRLVTDTGSAIVNIVNPDMEKNTVANLSKLAVGAGQLLIPGEQGQEDKARAVGNFYKDRYGGWDKIGNTLYNDPVGVVADVATVATGAGGALRGAGAAATKLGSVSRAGQLTRAGATLSKLGNAIDPLLASTKLAGSGVRAAGSKLSSTARTLAEDLPTRGLGNPGAQAKAKIKAGQSTSEFMRRYNWYDRSSDSVESITKDLSKKYDDKALRSGTSVQTGQIVTQIDAAIEKLQQGVNGVISDSDVKAIEELTRRKQQLLQAIGGEFKDGVQTSSPVQAKTSDLTRYRREVIDKDIPQSTYNLDAQASGTVRGTKTMRDFLRKSINSTDPELERIGLDIGQGKALEKVAKGYESRAANRQLFNFTKLGSAGIGSVLAGVPGVVGGFIAEQLVNSPQFLKIASNTLNKLADKLPQVKNITVKSKQALYKEILEAAQKEGSTNPEVLAQALAERYMLEPAYKEIIDNLGSEVAGEFDGKLMTADLKGTERSTQKIVKDAQKTEGAEQASSVGDISRNTVILPDYRQADRAARSLASKNKNMVYDPAKKDYFSKPTPAGYRGINTNLKTPVGMAEIQLNVPEMIVAKMPVEVAKEMLGEKQFNQMVASGIEPGLGHELYQKSRVIMEDAEALIKQRAKTPGKFELIDNVYYTPEEARQLEQINQASNALYDRAMDLHKERRSGIVPTAQAYGFTKNNAKKAVFSTGRAGRMNRSE